MAHTLLCLFVAFSLFMRSLQDNPVLEFCRRWSHQTAQVDGRLYIDGGQVTYGSSSSNHTNDWLLFNDLNSRTDDGYPRQYSNLSKPANIPRLSGGHLWADEVNKCFYQFGGEFLESSASDFGLWTYDVILNQWNSTKFVSSEKNLQRPAFGAGAHSESRGLGFYYGGWVSNKTTPGWEGPPLALSSIMQFDFTTGNLKNSTHPDGIGRAEGQMVFLPASDNGMLVYFGGIEDPYRNGSATAANMSNIHIFDINSGRWYSQIATGETPRARRQFCAGVTWPDDRSSFNIYLYGGYGFGDTAAFDDVYILSLPSFKWFKAFPLEGTQNNQHGHGGCSADIITPNQMLIIGGWFPSISPGECDFPNAQGQHNMILGNNTGKTDNGIWDLFDPKLSSYAVPTVVVSAIGGGPTGGATVTAPATWDHNDLKVYYKASSPSFPSRAATRALPAIATASAGDATVVKKKNIGAIAGGTIGGLVGLIAILSLILLCLHRRKKALKQGNKQHSSPPPAELAVTPITHEVSSSATNKYVAVRERHASNDYAYSELEAVQSPTARHDQGTTHAPDLHHSPYSTTPVTGQQWASTHETTQSHYAMSPARSPPIAEPFFPDANHHVRHGSRGQEINTTQPMTPQQQYIHIRQTSLEHQSPIQQVYYPPPQDLGHYTPPISGGDRGSPGTTPFMGRSQ